MKTIFKQVDRDKPYITIDKNIYNNPDISWKAKGLLTYLIGLPKDWELSPSDLTNRSKDGITTVRNIINELIEYGYIKRTTIRNEKKQITKWVYLVTEIPFDFEDATFEKPTSRKPISRKPKSSKKNTTNNTIKPNINISKDILTPEKFKDHYNKIAKRLDFPTVKKLSSTRSNKIKTRIESFGKDIFKMFSELKKQGYLKNESWFGIDFIIRNDRNIEKISNHWMAWKHIKEKDDYEPEQEYQVTGF